GGSDGSCRSHHSWAGATNPRIEPSQETLSFELPLLGDLSTFPASVRQVSVNQAAFAYSSLFSYSVVNVLKIPRLSRNSSLDNTLFLVLLQARRSKKP
ncbi:MAG: hypothetical protein COU72_02695, partial [Parcubacteria group bacterium CG10_big_fil_rev_8_21_14_0_10_41_35]